MGLCASRASSPEFSPGECRFGDACKFEHDLRKYLKDWKREDLTTFGGVCPIWYVYICPYSTYILLDLNSIIMLEENIAVNKICQIYTGFRLGRADCKLFIGKRKVYVMLDSNVASSGRT